MAKGKLVQAKRVRQSKMTDWIKRPIFDLTPETLKKHFRDGGVIISTGMPEIVQDGIFNLSTNKYKLNFKQAAIQAAIESGFYSFIVKMKLNFAKTDLTDDTAYSILGTMLYITKLSNDNKVYLCMSDGTTVAKKEITLVSGMTVSAIFAAFEIEDAPKMAVATISESQGYATAYGTKVDYDTTPSTIAFATAGTTTEVFKENALNICLQRLSFLDYFAGSADIKVALES